MRTQNPPAPTAIPLLDWLTKRAHWLVPSAIGLHALAWTALPTSINACLPLDTIEALLWGREWQMGYDKHPPLSAWAAELAGLLGRGRDETLYWLSQVCVIVAALAVWRLARDILDEGRAAFATLTLLVGVYYMNFTTPEFNVNVLQLPLWALLFLFFWRGVRGDKPAEPLTLLAWFGVGVCFGLGMLSKYLTAFVLPPLGLFMVMTPLGRRALRTPGPYLAALVASLVVLPHFLWMLETDFVTLKYGMRRAASDDAALLDHALNPMRFILAQTFAAAATLVVLFFSGAWLHGARGVERATVPRDARMFVWLLALGPVLAMAAYSAATGVRLRSMWGTPMLLAVPVLLAMLAKFDARPSRIRGFTTVWASLFALALGAYFVDNAVAPAFTDDAKRTNAPGRAIAEHVERAWAERGQGPLPILVAERWPGGLVSWYGPSRASVYIDADHELALWMTDDQVRARGGMVVWKLGAADRPEKHDRSFVEALRTRFPNLVELEPFTAVPRLRGPFARDLDDTAEVLGLAYIPAESRGAH